ncbi:MAG: hypothetical protein AB2799_17960 [Candidatus Thiodiazotropha sp.]
MKSNESIISDRNDRRNTMFMFFIGAGGLSILFAITYGGVDLLLKQFFPSDAPNKTSAELILWAWMIGCVNTVLFSVVGYFMSVYQPTLLSRCAEWVHNEVSLLSNIREDLDVNTKAVKKIIPMFLGEDFSWDAQTDEKHAGIVQALNSAINRIKLIREEIYVFSENPEDAERSFVCHEDNIYNSTAILRIAGTMAGVSGINDYDVIHHLCNLTEARIRHNKTPLFPFKTLQLAVPSRPVNADSTTGSNVYPYYARRFSLALFKEISKVVRNNGQNIPPSGLTIEIAYNNQTDQFPALQIWDERKCLVIPSAGVEDKDNIDGTVTESRIIKSIPLGIMIKDKIQSDQAGQKEINLENSLVRIVKYFDNTLFKSYKRKRKEIWTLEKSGAIRIKGWNHEAGGIEAYNVFMNTLKDDDKISKSHLESTKSGKPHNYLIKENILIHDSDTLQVIHNALENAIATARAP